MKFLGNTMVLCALVWCTTSFCEETIIEETVINVLKERKTCVEQCLDSIKGKNVTWMSGRELLGTSVNQWLDVSYKVLGSESKPVNGQEALDFLKRESDKAKELSDEMKAKLHPIKVFSVAAIVLPWKARERSMQLAENEVTGKHILVIEQIAEQIKKHQDEQETLLKQGARDANLFIGKQPVQVKYPLMSSYYTKYMWGPVK